MGSEMCIRDSLTASHARGADRLSTAMELLAALNAAGFLMAILAHRFLFPPPREKCPTRTALLGSLTFLTVQSNLICYYYNFMRLLYPLAFSLGVILTPLYNGLNHFVAEKIRLDGV